MASTPVTEHEWTVHSINIHGLFFERWCQQTVSEAKGWRLDSVNYPVEFPPPNGPIRGKESALDIRASSGPMDVQHCLLIECKKNNPEFVNWLFFKKPVGRGEDGFIISRISNRPHEGGREGWDTSSSAIRGDFGLLVCDEAREVRGDYAAIKNAGTKTKTSNAAIQEAAYQVALARQAVMMEDAHVCDTIGRCGPFPATLPWRDRIYLATIVTTAHLWLCEFDAHEVTPKNGEIPFAKVNISAQQCLAFEYPLPRHLQLSPLKLPEVYTGGRDDLFTRFHIIVVHSEYLPQFLAKWKSE